MKGQHGEAQSYGFRLPLVLLVSGDVCPVIISMTGTLTRDLRDFPMLECSRILFSNFIAH